MTEHHFDGGRSNPDKPVAHFRYGRTSILVTLSTRSDFVNRKMHDVTGASFNTQAQRWELPFDPRAVSEALELVSREFRPETDEMTRRWLPVATAKTKQVLDALTEQEPPLQCDPDGQLFPFQRRGVHVAATAGRFIIGDEMGLGKTPQGIKTIQEMERRGKLSGDGAYLIVVPKTLIGNWVNEIKKWVGDDAEITVLKSSGLTELVGKRAKPFRGYYIINWDKISSRLSVLQQFQWDVIMGDEAHRIKNREAARTKAMFQLRDYAKHRFLLTGTPMKNKLPELWTLLHFVNPLRFPSYWKFVNRYCEVEDNIWGRKEIGDPKPERKEELDRVLSTILLARREEDVELELPEKTHKKIPVTLGPKQRRIYNQMLDQFVAWLGDQPDEDNPDLIAANAMVQMLKLKQIAGTLSVFGDPEHTDSAKLDTLEEILADNPGEKFVVMSQFKSVVEDITRRLKAKKIGHARLDGDHQHLWRPSEHELDDVGERVSERSELASAFQRTAQEDADNGEDPIRLFVSTIQTGGEGLTLTQARYFVFVDQLWTPADNDQAWKRIHRISQVRHCHILYLMADDTVDHLVMGTVNRKRDIIDAVLRTKEQRGKK